MKSILVIGIGRFGQHLCENLAKHDNQIMAVDISEEKLEPVLPYVVSAKIGDCTNEAVLKSLGIGNFDICFICIGNNFQNSLEVTSLIKETDIRRLYGISVIAVKNPDGHMRFMPGADHIIAGDNHLMVIGKQEDAEKIVKHLTKNV